MYYCGIIEHPEHGTMLNLTESAKYLGVSRKKFRRIAPAPGYKQDGISPFWAKQVLDITPVTEDFDQDKILRRGKTCGQHLIADMDEQQLRALRNALLSAHPANGHFKERTETVLAEHGVPVSFPTKHEAMVFRDGVLSAIRSRVQQRVLTMERREAWVYVMSFWGGGSYEGLRFPE